MIIEIVLGQVFLLNLFPNKYGLSKSMSPRQIMSGLKYITIVADLLLVASMFKPMNSMVTI